MLHQLKIKGQTDKTTVMAAALLHDTGHGPFSHLFENFLSEVQYKPKGSSNPSNHEDWTEKIIKNDSEIIACFEKHQIESDRVVEIISNQHEKHHLSDIVSSQLDADKFDYMLRDSLMTGVSYGKFDINWLFRNLLVGEIEIRDDDGMPTDRKKKEIIVDGKRGLSVLEDYLLSNYYLYKHVYFHKTIQAAEGMLIKVLVRAVDLRRQGTDIGINNSAIDSIANNCPLSLNDYLELNDGIVFSWLNYWSKSGSDSILKELSSKLLNRKLYKVTNFQYSGLALMTHKTEAIAKKLQDNKYDLKYHRIFREGNRVAYKNYFQQTDGKPNREIYVKGRTGKPKEYSSIGPEVSRISAAIKELNLNEEYIIVPEDVADDVKKILKQGE